jgi:hypothetical protein
MLAARHQSDKETSDAPLALDRPGAIALGLLWVALVLVLWFGLFVGSMRASVPRTEAIDLDGYLLPKFEYAAQEVAAGRLPLWNPFEYAGLPLLGAGQSAVLYPPRIVLFGVLPPTAAFHGYMVLHYLLLGVGAFVCLRVLGCGWPGAALGAVAIAFQPLMLQGHYHPMRMPNFAWVPLVLAAFVRTLERPGRGPVVGLAAALALEVLAGYPEWVVDTVVALVLVWPFVAGDVARRGSGLLRGSVLAAAAMLAAALLTAPHWIPLLDMARASARAPGRFVFMEGTPFDVSAFGSGARAWVAALSLLTYLPALAWVTLAWGLAVPGARHRPAMLALLAVAHAGPSLLDTVPPFSFFRGPLCWASIAHLPLGLLAAQGLDRVVALLAPGATRPSAREVAAGAVALAVVVPLSAGRALLWLGIGMAALLAARGRGRRARSAAVVVALVSALGAVWTHLPPGVPAGLPHRWAAGVPVLPDLGVAAARGDEIRRACGLTGGGRVLAPLDTWRGVPVAARLPAVQGYPESLPPARMTRLLEAAGLAPQTAWPLDRARLPEAGPVLDLLDVRCVVAEAGEETPWRTLGYAPRATLGDGRVAWTRAGAAAFVPAGLRAVADESAALASVRAPGFTAAREIVLEPGAPAGGPGEGGRVEEVGDAVPGRLRFRVEAPEGGWLVVSENWFPGWQARVDGRPATVIRADYTLLAVRLDPGARAVELWYRPPAFALALGLALGGATLLAGLALVGTRR